MLPVSGVFPKRFQPPGRARKRTLYGIRINKAGWIYILLTLVVGFAAVNTGNNLIYIIVSALLSYMIVSGIFGRKNLRGLEVTLEIPEEIYAGTQVPIQIRVLNQKRFLPALLINVAINREQTFFPAVSARSQATRWCSMSIDQRGRFTPGAITISSMFPFNFFTRHKTVSEDLQWIVLPRPVRCQMSPQQHRQLRFKGDAVAAAAGYDSDLIAIRDYVSGDPLKYISWKATAKTGVIKTKELSAVGVQPVLIDFDRMEKTNLEYKISCVTYVILKLLRLNIPVGLAIDGETCKPGVSAANRMRMLRKLALHGQD